MTEPAHPPSGGAHPPTGGGGGSGVGKAWGFAILAIVLIMTGVLAMLGQQVQVLLQAIAQGIGMLFQMIKMNISSILILIAAYWAIKALKK